MKTVLITGTTRGIGKALAEKFIKENYFVIGTSFTGINIADGDNFKGYDLDLSSEDSIIGFCNKIKEDGFKIDILINNAGALFDEFNQSVIIEKLRKTLEINLIGTINLTENIIPFLSDGSQIFNMSSTAGMLSKDLDMSKRYPAYKISKTALNMYTRTLAANMIDRNVFVASIHPGWVKTDMGGNEADMTVEESSWFIYDFVVKEKDIKDTGLFWFKGERLNW